MEISYWVIPVAALIPLVIGAIWYNPNVFGSIWLKTSGLTEEEAQSGNMAVIFGLSYLFGLFIAMTLLGIVIHQNAITSLMISETDFMVDGSEAQLYYAEFMERLGDKHRSFGHGALHGGLVGLLLAMPIIGTIALFERRGFKYIAVHSGYWILTMALMGGLICQLA